jgi:hypothetical protein
MAMTTTQNPAGSNVDQLADNGLARLAGCCYDHLRRVLLGSAKAAE